MQVRFFQTQKGVAAYVFTAEAGNVVGVYLGIYKFAAARTECAHKAYEGAF